MAIETLPMARIQADDSLSPRARLDRKHVDEFVEMGGEWPPVLVRPIAHQWYTHQLVDGFHRFEAAQHIGQETIAARVENLDDVTALARALRENLHGRPMSPDERKARCVRLYEMGQTQEWIARETGVTEKQVSVYLAAERVAQQLTPGKMDESATTTPKLTINQAAALGKLIPNPDDHRRAPTGPTLLQTPTEKEQRQAAARPHLPAIAQAAADHHLPPATVSALADATLAAPEHAPAIVEKAISDELAPDAIRALGKVLGDDTAPDALKAHVLQPDTMIHDQHGVYPASELDRASDLARRQTPEHHALPFASALIAIDKVTAVSPDAIEAWYDSADTDMADIAEDTLTALQEWLTTAIRISAARRKRRFTVLG